MTVYLNPTSESNSRKRGRISDPESEFISRKKGRNGVSNTLQNKNLTPVTIMVADTISTVTSRRFLLVSGSTTILINKRCLSKKYQP